MPKSQVSDPDRSAWNDIHTARLLAAQACVLKGHCSVAVWHVMAYYDANYVV